jgi:hypothetical protein
MKLNNKFDSKDKKKYCRLLYRQLKMACENKNSLLYLFYGAKGIKCELSSTSELECLYIRDKVDLMNEPFLARRNENSSFSRENCYFYDRKVTLKEIFKRVYGREI